MKKISIIVPAYNIEEYLPRCLDSIIAQTYENLEIIVVDDGSTDSTGAVADAYAAKDPRIKVIHQENLGLSGARNSALRIITGEYVGYVDGDDYITTDMYLDMMGAIESSNAELAVCAYEQIGDGAEDIDYSGQVYPLSTKEALEIYICDDRSFHIYNSVWSKLFKREIISGFNFPTNKNSEDIMYTTRALLNSSKVVFVDKPLYRYVLDRAGSIMNEDSKEKFAYRRLHNEIPFWKEQQEYIRTSTCPYITDEERELLYKKAQYHFYRRMLFYYMDFGTRKMPKARKELADMVLADKPLIKDLYSEPFIKTGDRTRMKLFLASPKAYSLITTLYEKIVLPLRN